MQDIVEQFVRLFREQIGEPSNDDLVQIRDYVKAPGWYEVTTVGGEDLEIVPVNLTNEEIRQARAYERREGFRRSTNAIVAAEETTYFRVV